MPRTEITPELLSRIVELHGKGNNPTRISELLSVEGVLLHHSSINKRLKKLGYDTRRKPKNHHLQNRVRELRYTVNGGSNRCVRPLQEIVDILRSEGHDVGRTAINRQLQEIGAEPMIRLSEASKKQIIALRAIENLSSSKISKAMLARGVAVSANHVTAVLRKAGYKPAKDDTPRTKLDRYSDVIQQLHGQGLNYAEIKSELAAKGCRASKATIAEAVKRFGGESNLKAHEEKRHKLRSKIVELHEAGLYINEIAEHLRGEGVPVSVQTPQLVLQEQGLVPKAYKVKRSEVVHAVLELRAAGYTYKAICFKMRERGERISVSSVGRIVNSQDSLNISA